MDFTIVDGGVAAVAVISGLLAWSRGLTRELFAILGWMLAALAAFYLAPLVEPLLREVPVVGSFLATSCVLSMIAAFVIVVALALLVLSVFTPLLSNAILDSPLAPLDRALGFIFGVVRGLALVAIAWLLYESLSGGSDWPPLENAYSREVFADIAAAAQANLPEGAPGWFGARVDGLMAPCGGQAPAAAAATIELPGRQG